MLDDNVSPAADQPESRALGKPLVTIVALISELGCSLWYGCPPLLLQHKFSCTRLSSADRAGWAASRLLFSVLLVEGTYSSSGPMCLHFLN
eukprot:1148465-Pelagomonas_calceolata.AAC.1